MDFLIHWISTFQTLWESPDQDHRAFKRLISGRCASFDIQIDLGLKHLLQGIPSCSAWPRQLDSSALWVQACVYLGLVLIWYWFTYCLAMYSSSVIRRLLCCHLHYRKRSRLSRNRSKSLHHRWASYLQHMWSYSRLWKCSHAISVCGPPRYSEMRINLSQAFNGIGTVVAPTLGSYVFFTQDPDDPSALENVQWVYLAIACFVFLLAIVFYLWVPRTSNSA